MNSSKESIFKTNFPLNLKMSKRGNVKDEMVVNVKGKLVNTSFPQNFFVTKYYQNLVKASNKIGK